MSFTRAQQDYDSATPAYLEDYDYEDFEDHDEPDDDRDEDEGWEDYLDGHYEDFEREEY